MVTTPDGPVAPGGAEARIDALDAVLRSAVVGVGPHGTQAVVAVVEVTGRPDTARARPGLAPTDLTAAVREAAAPVAVAAVLVTDRVPVDIRTTPRSTAPGWAAGPTGCWRGRVAPVIRRVLVTGASGLLGAGVAARLVAAGTTRDPAAPPLRVHGARDVTGSVPTRRRRPAMTGRDTVVHVAAKVSVQAPRPIRGG